MKCKVFNIRLAESFASDEANLNKFLDGIAVKRIITSFAGMSWFTLIFYEEMPEKLALKNSDEIMLSPEGSVPNFL